MLIKPKNYSITLPYHCLCVSPSWQTTGGQGKGSHGVASALSCHAVPAACCPGLVPVVSVCEWHGSQNASLAVPVHSPLNCILSDPWTCVSTTIVFKSMYTHNTSTYPQTPRLTCLHTQCRQCKSFGSLKSFQGQMFLF